MTQSTPSLGVSALLDELLADERHEDPEPQPLPGDLADQSVDGAHFAALHGAPPHRTWGEASPSQVLSITPGDGAQGAEEDVSRQIAELCGEMDSCLNSLSRWDEERAREKEALKAKLEKQYGFRYDEGLMDRLDVEPMDSERLNSAEAFVASGAVDDDDDDDDPDGPDMFAQSISGEVKGANAGLYVNGRGLRPRQDYGGSLFGSDDTDGPSPSSAQLEEAVLREDEARLARLRLEVEGLRRKEQETVAGPSELADDTMALDTSMALANLQEWCSEVDAVVKGMDGEEPLHLSTAGVEQQLDHARDNLGVMEDALDLARVRMDAELKDLETMLLETDAIQSRVAELPQKQQN